MAACSRFASGIRPNDDLGMLAMEARRTRRPAAITATRLGEHCQNGHETMRAAQHHIAQEEEDINAHPFNCTPTCLCKLLSSKHNAWSFAAGT